MLITERAGVQTGVQHARIEATFVRVRGQTQIARSYASAPLKIARAFPLDDGKIGVCVMDSSPGMLAGDCYEFDWRLEPGARVFLTNQSFTKVHPSRERPCSQIQKIAIASDALLELLPEPVTLYSDAALTSTSEIDIESGGTLLLSDILCAGRVARGEVFEFESWRSRLRVRYDGELVFANQSILQPRCHDPRSHAGWGDSTYLGNLYLFTDTLSAPLWNELLTQLRDVLELFPTVRGGASLLERHGLAVSLLGARAYDLQQVVHALRENIRAFLPPGT
ncbi:MAG TPA: urease accessory protein UreD [Abditibacteriaceae bacterium]